LAAAGIPYMVIGGQAVLLHGQPRATLDIDITLGVDVEAFGRVLDAAGKIGLDPIPEDPEAFARRTMVLPAKDRDSGIRVDFIFSFLPYERQAIERAKAVPIDGVHVRFASVEDLVIHKMFAGRPRDIEDVRGAQPKPDGYATLKAMGIRTVINLRTRHGEREAVEAAGMRYVEIPMSCIKKVDTAAVRKALSVMTDPASQPVFVHCSRGADRTAVVAAVYRMEVDGWSEAEAEAEREAFGFHEVWFQLKKFVRQYQEVQEEVRAVNGP